MLGSYRLSDIMRSLLKPYPGGTAKGYCMICGGYTEEGLEPSKAFSQAYTEYNKLVAAGGVVCPVCAAALRTPELRRRSWLATPSELRFLKRTEVYGVLLDPPEPPFALYATRTGKKQGWVVLGPMVAVSRSIYPVSFDGELVIVDSARVREYHSLIERLLGAGARKSELLGGCKPKTFAADSEACRRLEAVRGNPLWGLMVWAHP